MLKVERALTFNVIGRFTLPWKAEYQGQQHKLGKMRTAQDVVKLAADTRKAWINAAAAETTAHDMGDAKVAAHVAGSR